MNVDLLSVKSLLEFFSIFSPLHMKCQNAVGKQPYVAHLVFTSLFLILLILGAHLSRDVCSGGEGNSATCHYCRCAVEQGRCTQGGHGLTWMWLVRKEVYAWGTVVGSYNSGYHGGLLPSNNPVVRSVTIYFYVRGGEGWQMRKQDMPCDIRNYVAAIVISMTTRNIANYGKREQNSRWTGYTVFHSFHPARSKIISVTLKRATLLEANTELLKNWVANVPGTFQKIARNLYFTVQSPVVMVKFGLVFCVKYALLVHNGTMLNIFTC